VLNNGRKSGAKIILVLRRYRDFRVGGFFGSPCTLTYRLILL